MHLGIWLQRKAHSVSGFRSQPEAKLDPHGQQCTLQDKAPGLKISRSAQ